MGFLKRLFSIGGKSKKQKKFNIQHNTPVPELPEPAQSPVQDEEDHEEAIGRLLRSSSQRYAVVSEVDYTNMPPMPHPINNVLNPQFAASTISLASTTLGSRPTYNVTVHRRERQGSSESQLRRDPETPRRKYGENLNANDSRVLRLRSDPSVASLVSLYDEHGRLPEAAFSNSPPSEKRERAQCKRSGSTLRQLLGAPSTVNSRRNSDVSGDEGDISWAERFLGETESASTHSSLPLPTPITGPAFLGDVSVSSVLTDGTMDNPAISSMDVELSISTNASEIFGEEFQKQTNSPYKNPDPATPQRASQVFDFITKKKQSKFVEEDERPLPDLPSVFSSPSSEGGHSNGHLGSRFSEDSCESAFAKERISAIPIPCDTQRNYSRPLSHQFDSFTTKFGDNDTTPRDVKRFTFNVTTPIVALEEPQDPEPTVIPVYSQPTPVPQVQVCTPVQERPVKVIMTGPTKVIVTAPTPSSAHPATSTRIPRGPRSLNKRRMSGSRSDKHRRSTQLERSNTGGDVYSSIPAHSSRRRSSHQRASSIRSNPSVVDENEAPVYHKPSSKDRSRGIKYRDEQTVVTLGVKADIPLTPLRSQNTNTTTRSNSTRSALFKDRTSITQNTFDPPEADVKRQRSKARDTERERLTKYQMPLKQASVYQDEDEVF